MFHVKLLYSKLPNNSHLYDTLKFYFNQIVSRGTMVAGWLSGGFVLCRQGGIAGRFGGLV